MFTIFGWNFEIEERCKGVHCVDLGESFPIYPNSNEYSLAKSASILPRTSPSKFGRKFNSIFIRLLSKNISQSLPTLGQSRAPVEARTIGGAPGRWRLGFWSRIAEVMLLRQDHRIPWSWKWTKADLFVLSRSDGLVAHHLCCEHQRRSIESWFFGFLDSRSSVQFCNLVLQCIVPILKHNICADCALCRFGQCKFVGLEIAWNSTHLQTSIGSLTHRLAFVGTYWV